MDKPRYCYYVSEDMKDAEGYYTPVVVRRDVPGYNPTDYRWSKDFEETRRIARKYNEVFFKCTPEDEAEIIASSIAAQNARNKPLDIE